MRIPKPSTCLQLITDALGKIKPEDLTAEQRIYLAQARQGAEGLELHYLRPWPARWVAEMDPDPRLVEALRWTLYAASAVLFWYTFAASTWWGEALCVVASSVCGLLASALPELPARLAQDPPPNQDAGGA